MDEEIPLIEHKSSDIVTLIGENELIKVEERSSPGTIHKYTVVFKGNDPDASRVDIAINIMKIFKEIPWDFILLCDMRGAKILSQMMYITTYRKLIGLIENPRCKYCYVYIKPLPTILGHLVVSSIQTIVNSLGVQCTMVEKNN
jgi:hypothetical protein